MALLVFNKTIVPLLLAAGNPPRTVPSSTAPGVRGPAFNITSELRGLTGGQYTALQVQVAASSCEYEWTSDPEFATGTLVVGGPAPGAHATQHKTGGSDALATASVTPTNNTGNAVPAVTDGGHTHASSAVTDGGHTHASSAVTDGGHTHTATVNALRIAGHVGYAATSAADAPASVATIMAAVLPADGAQIVAAQPDVPRKIQVEVLLGPSTTGDVTVDGLDPSGAAITETFSIAAIALLKSAKAYSKITAITMANVTGAAGTVGVGPANDLGVPMSQVPAGAGLVVFKAACDGADEAVGVVDAAAGTIAPTTAPNGVHDFDFWFTYSATPTAPATGSATTGVTVGATASGTTGVTVGASASATTGITVADGGHGHTQNAHSHNLT